MTGDPDPRRAAALEALERAAVARRDAVGAARLAGSAGVIRGAVVAGVPVARVAGVLGVSRQAVYAVLREGDGS